MDLSKLVEQQQSICSPGLRISKENPENPENLARKAKKERSGGSRPGPGPTDDRKETPPASLIGILCSIFRASLESLISSPLEWTPQVLCVCARVCVRLIDWRWRTGSGWSYPSWLRPLYPPGPLPRVDEQKIHDTIRPIR